MAHILLEVSQMLRNHPILLEKESYKVKYIQVLDYFVQKYSKGDKWANAVLQLYIHRLLGENVNYVYDEANFSQKAKDVVSTKFKPFKFFTYRYCLVFDCIFINAYNSPEKGKKIFSELITIYHKRYHAKIQRVFDFLYDRSIDVNDIDQIEYMRDCWNANRDFLSATPIKIIVTANMSAGKSTLLNALVGKRVTKTQNDACTAKIHYIVNKAYEDGFCYEHDYLLNLDANLQTLMDDNEDNASSEISVGTYFRTLGSNHKPICLIDTPGVNSSRNSEHKAISKQAIKNASPDLLLFLLNGENIGTDDDRQHLCFIQENYHGKILFVVNKVDRFRKNEDSVQDTISAVVNDLHNIGFIDPVVVPVSAYAAYLAKMKIFGEELDEDEEFEFSRMSRKMKKDEYQFNRYFSDGTHPSVDVEGTDAHQLLLHSGIMNLENMIYNLR